MAGRQALPGAVLQMIRGPVLCQPRANVHKHPSIWIIKFIFKSIICRWERLQSLPGFVEPEPCMLKHPARSPSAIPGKANTKSLTSPSGSNAFSVASLLILNWLFMTPPEWLDAGGLVGWVGVQV